MQSEWRAQVELHVWKLGSTIVPEPLQITCNMRTSAQKVRHHQDVIGAGVNTLANSVRDRWIRQFEITGHDDLILTLFTQPVGDDDQVVVRFGAAAPMGNQQNGGCHDVSLYLLREPVQAWR